MSKNPDDIEVELKLALPEDQLESVFLSLKDKAGKKGICDKHRPRDYYDTVSLKLLSKRVALRVQLKEGRGYEQTIKYAPSGQEEIRDGILARMEWKDWVTENKPDIGIIGNEEAKALFTDIKQKRLFHVFTADVKRRYFVIDVEMPGGQQAKVELAFDKGHVKLAPPYKGKETVCEIEIEMKQGSDQAIDVVKEMILKMAPQACVSTRSKAQMGYSLYEEALKKQVKKFERVRFRP